LKDVKHKIHYSFPNTSRKEYESGYLRILFE
jgi:hypothetical protein